MENDLRKNPRFISAQGIPAKLYVDGKVLDGTLLDFSSTGFATVVGEDIGHINQTSIDVVFAASNTKRELKLSALITNKRPQDASNTRLGCHITSMHDLENEYFAFLTIILGTQGLLRSMATKPKKAIQAGTA